MSSDADSVQIIDITNPSTPVQVVSIFDNVQPIVDSDASSPMTIVLDDVQAADPPAREGGGSRSLPLRS